MTGTGWLPQQVDDLCLPDVRDLLYYWDSMPPAHVTLHRLLVAVEALMGVEHPSLPKPPSLSQVMGSQQGDINDLLAMFPTGEIK